MTCAACATRVEKALNKITGVDAAVNLATERAHVRLTGSAITAPDLIAAVERAGYGATLATIATRDLERARKAALASEDLTQFWWALAFTVPLVVQMAPMLWGSGHGDLLPRWIQLALATPVQFWIGQRFFIGAWKALRAGAANMDVLVVLGTLSAYLLSVFVTIASTPGAHVYFESATVVITLVLLGKILESRARARTNSAVDALLRLRPAMAHVLRDGAVVDIKIDDVVQGDRLQVRPGEAIPVDAEVLSGQSSVDEAMLTGESVPVGKLPGSGLFAGTINQDGVLECRATGVGADTAVGRIVRMVEAAQGSKAAVQKQVDRVATVFVPVIVVIAGLTLIGWWLAGAGMEVAIVNACAVLVISCPCALGLATPTALMVGIGRGAERGILIKDANALELAERVRILVVDKTGTLTEGRPSVTRVIAAPGVTERELLVAAVAIGQGSEHPLSRAMARHAAEQGVPIQPASGVRAIAGQGVHGIVMGGDGLGRRTWLGSPAFIRTLQHLGSEIRPNDFSSGSVVGVADEARMLGWIELADALRPTTQTAIARLRRLDIEVVMLTGDRPGAAQAIARAVGITRFESEVMPADKAARVAALKEGGVQVAMAGDGVNDAPALAAADVSFAMGAGSDVAIQSAGVTLMRADINGVADAIELSRATMRKVWQNLAFAFGYNVLAIPVAALGLLNPALAGAAMALSSLSVVGNALLLRRWRPAA
ncbi:MAG: copper-translocating P-type ATPase [Betaproteobacteria bacterium]|nr:copper-translocating P-type ATPase [Betaproteobacteria bacterium]